MRSSTTDRTCPLCGLPLRYGQQRHGPAVLFGEAVHVECMDQQQDEPTQTEVL